MKILLYLLSPILFSLVACNNSNNDINFSSVEKLHYTETGNKIVEKSFDTLRNSLQAAIAGLGIENAVSYCKINAYPLTDIYASDSVLVRRTALKYRNPANKPDTSEERVLNFFTAQREKRMANDSLSTITEKSKNGTVHFYKPIMLQPMCSSCHGSKVDAMQSAIWNTIDSLYPLDMAYGFKTNSLRGMWHVTFIKKEGK